MCIESPAASDYQKEYADLKRRLELVASTNEKLILLLKMIRTSLESDAAGRSEGTWRYSINEIDKALSLPR